jgi:hypothetical protein
VILCTAAVAGEESVIFAFLQRVKPSGFGILGCTRNEVASCSESIADLCCGESWELTAVTAFKDDTSLSEVKEFE